MFCRTLCFFVILCSYVNIIESTTESLSDTQLKHTSIQNEKVHRVFSVVKSEKKRKMVRQTTAILNDDLDIPLDTFDSNSSEIKVLYESEGSGTDEFEEIVVKTTITREAKSENTELINTTSVYTISTNYVTQSTKNERESAMTSEDDKKNSALTDADSSGDDILLLTTELTTEKPITPEDIIPEIAPDICLNTTCSVNNLSVSISDNHSFIAEGINLTLSCKSNSSNDMMYWYKSNGSVYFLQTFGTVEELHLNIPDIKTTHSGKYMCIRRIDKLTCCNLESNLSVYKLPLYKYHLIIIGLIAAVCLITCIFLSVRQVMSLKIYSKQFVEKHGKAKTHQLL